MPDNIRKNDLIPQLHVTDMTAEGNGVGHIKTADGSIAVFVSGAVTGDIIECRIIKVLKNYLFGRIENIITPSPDRYDRGCPVKKTCGGCTFRHISYEAELRFKENAVKNAFLRIGGFEENSFEYLPIIGSEQTDRYRNKAQYPVSADKEGNMHCGFYAKRSHRVNPVSDCLLQPTIFGEITSLVLENAVKLHITPYDETTGRGMLRHIYIRQGHHSGEIMVCLVAAKEDKKFSVIAEKLREKFPRITSVILNINSRNTNVILGDKCVTLSGKDNITDIMCGNKISISPLSFYQVNTPQAERLYAQAGEFAALTGNEDVLDLYCGAGTIGLSLADKTGHITGAEIIPQAVENAKNNAKANNIKNADFICADAGQAAAMLLDRGRRPDVIITDPPRKGCDELTLSSIVKMSPDRVVMVSCDPATAARDCKRLAEMGYTLKKLRAADLFPSTGHVECVLLMTKE